MDLLIPEIISATYSTGVRRDFEPEDAPTGRSDSVCLVFLRFPRRLYQVRRMNMCHYSLCYSVSSAVKLFHTTSPFIDFLTRRESLVRNRGVVGAKV